MTKSKKILILGGGLSGLSAALKLKQTNKNIDITILEKKPYFGGLAGSFKHNLQRIINAVTGESKMIFLAKAPPHMSNATRDAVIQEYNLVIDELIVDNGFSGYSPPDFHTYFINNPGEMSDNLHPNGQGYESMARLWCESLNGQLSMVCSAP